MIDTCLFTTKGASKGVPLTDWRELVADGRALLWVDVRSAKREELDEIAALFGFHAVAVNSCLDPYRRPHLYEFSDYFYLNFTVLRSGGEHGVKGSELNVFAGANFIVTVSRDERNEAVEKTLDEYLATPSLCSRGPMYGVYLLAEDLIETYSPLVDRLDDQADQLETRMLESADKATLSRLFDLKREGYELRKLLGPQRDAFSELARRDFPFIQGENRVYFQDAYGRMIRLFDMLDTVREILSGCLDIHLSTVSNRLNEVMKVLTVAATILMTLSFITGFYGMNFVHLPWLKSPNAFRNITIFMAALTVGMAWWFKRKKWM